ncbi:TetR family transcriptional regulator [Kitasatospora sp. DSM 101779]|uniref:TetR family transcriptional regulator n=1 Tax=Kitasatospora sp. DSM 101779 TaxID=2853165 RepID=UPI0021DAF8A7|nr:TetR family transcriptional regulator [Kitasatospora sp. DSM 101779]MCU7821770.1 TetR family transcriptional regulator [Kitasatospora sp. DSM 101779]
MTKVDLSPRPVEAMSPRQLERRGNLIAAALALVTEIGVERLQMRQVSERSGVALGTTYRYFSSKDHLLAAAIAEWHRSLLTDLVGEVRGRRAGLTASDRMVRFVRHGMRAYQRQPELARLRVSVAASTDPFASEALQAMARADGAALRAVMTEVPPSTGDVVRHIVGHAWQGELTAWVTGRTTLDDARRRLEDVVRLVLTPYEAADPAA